MTTLRDAARHAVLWLVRRGADRLGFDLVARGWQSPLPKLDLIPEEAWTSPSPLVGVDIDPSSQFDFLDGVLAPYLAEFHPPLEPTGGQEFHLRNGSFETVDAEVLYAMIRHARPSKVLELGAGHSTLVAAAAIRRNRDSGVETHFVAVDPGAPAFLDPPPPELDELRRTPATAVPLEDFEALAPGDILFIDTTHVVAVGSEVNYVVLEVLPRLRPGVFVHFHDIFIPWDYPRHWVEDLGYYWTEQYLLHAFLCFNPAYRVRIAAHRLARTAPERLARIIPSYHGAPSPGSFWIERIDQ
jgi:methyltransferase family protein